MPLSLPEGPGNPGNRAKPRALAPGTLPTATSRGSGRAPGQPALPCVWQPWAVPSRHSVGQPTAQVQDASWPVLLPRGGTAFGDPVSNGGRCRAASRQDNCSAGIGAPKSGRPSPPRFRHQGRGGGGRRLILLSCVCIHRNGWLRVEGLGTHTAISVQVQGFLAQPCTPGSLGRVPGPQVKNLARRWEAATRFVWPVLSGALPRVMPG